jgi:hypothetical protein
LRYQREGLRRREQPLSGPDLKYSQSEDEILSEITRYEEHSAFAPSR